MKMNAPTIPKIALYWLICSMRVYCSGVTGCSRPLLLLLHLHVERRLPSRSVNCGSPAARAMTAADEEQDAGRLRVAGRPSRTWPRGDVRTPIARASRPGSGAGGAVASVMRTPQAGRDVDGPSLNCTVPEQLRYWPVGSGRCPGAGTVHVHHAGRDAVLAVRQAGVCNRGPVLDRLQVMVRVGSSCHVLCAAGAGGRPRHLRGRRRASAGHGRRLRRRRRRRRRPCTGTRPAWSRRARRNDNRVGSLSIW